MKSKSPLYIIMLILMFALGAASMWVLLRNQNRSFAEDDPCADLVVVEQGVDTDEAELDPLAIADSESPEEMPAEDATDIAVDGEDSATDALNEWERLVNKYAGSDKGKIECGIDFIKEFKKTFDMLSDEQKKDSIHDALNLLSNGYEMLLAAILLDESEPEGVLECIYADIMNRDDAVKTPIFEMLAEDTAHPLSVKAAEWLRQMKEKKGL